MISLSQESRRNGWECEQSSARHKNTRVECPLPVAVLVLVLIQGTLRNSVASNKILVWVGWSKLLLPRRGEEILTRDGISWLHR